MVTRNSLVLVVVAAAAIGASPDASAQERTPSPVPRVTDLKKLSVEELMEIEIFSVSKRSERLLEAPASIFVISADDIRRSGVTTLPEALRLAPNLNVARVDPVQFAISSRGFNNAVGNKLLVLIDGRTVYTPLFSGVFWDQQDVLLEDIERIEVISGPGATLWGANAVNGVINIITRPATDTYGALVSTSVGSDDRGFGLRWGGKVKSASYRAYVKVTDWDNTRQANGVEIPNDWRRSQAGLRADWAGAVDTVTVQGDVYAGESEHRGFVGRLEVPAVEVAGANLLARWGRRFTNGSDLQVQTYFDRATRDDFVLFRPKGNIADIEIQHGIPWKAHKFLVGGGYRHASDQIDPAVFSIFFPDKRQLNWGNVFGQGELRVSEQVRATVGTKLERNDYTGIEVLPSVRVAWKHSERGVLWGSVSRAVRAPSRYDRDVFFPNTPPFVVVGGPNFESEVANVVELGYRSQPQSTLSFSIVGFTHVWDKLRSGTAIPVELENRIDGSVYGVEAWATYQPTDLVKLSAGGTYLKEDLRLEPGSGDPVGTFNPTLRNDPDYFWSLRSTFDLPASFELDLNLRGVGALPNPSVPRYTELDLRFGRRWRNADVGIVGRDLLHGHHPEFGALPGRSEIPRRVFGTIAWRF